VAQKCDDAPFQFVELDLARLADCLCSPNARLYDDEQFLRIKRLDEVVLCSHGLASQTVLLLSTGSQEDERDRHPHRSFVNLFEEPVPVHAWHGDVGDDQVRGERL